MDKEIRNRIQRATQSARSLLENEYAEQLEGVFDIRLDGTIAPNPGDHLDATQKVQRTKILGAIAHLTAGAVKKGDAILTYLRDAAFTTLNRFVALKMLESRGLVQECLSQGEQSAGFKEFTGLAPGLIQLTDHGYRIYIESLFDEVSREVQVLFDRRDPVSVLWPRRLAFAEILSILNDNELLSVWPQDETIGWIYQYFNSDDERKKMRTESAAPRDSRELAVRNQFFTPRYVVQFLTDNTLGSIWYEMRKGDTKLRELDYLMRKANEIFLAEFEEPKNSDEDVDNLSQEQILKHPAQVAFRSKKDPRDIRIIDPACGSGHFLLYSFDLFITIYEEAWSDSSSPPSECTGHSLKEDYPDIVSLRSAIPGLILYHNLHGIDIDARCAQIAALSLWMRAQNAYKYLGIDRENRKKIDKVNVAVAEPLPGNDVVYQMFIASLESELGELVEHIFSAMNLAGEAGSLLKIEHEIQTVLRKVYGTDDPQFRESNTQWQQAEKLLFDSIIRYTEKKIDEGTFRRRLFASDAAQGLAFIDMCQQRYDVLLMNPPFGDGTPAVLDMLGKQWPKAKRNLYIGFMYRASELVNAKGKIGAITDATFIHQTRYEEFRSDLVSKSDMQLSFLIACGWGVLDAYVETACVIVSKSPGNSILTIDVREDSFKEAKIRGAISSIYYGKSSLEAKIVSRSSFRNLPKNVLAFWLPPSILRQYRSQPALDPTLMDARCGMSSSDNPRFYKLWWEVNPKDIGNNLKWRFLANGGTPIPILRQQVYVINWGKDGREAKSRVADLYGSSSRTIINEPYYFRPGFTFGKRTESFTVQFLPKGQVFSNEGQAIFPHDEQTAINLLAYLNCSLVAYILNSVAGQHKEAGYVGSIPSPPENFLTSSTVKRRTQEAFNILVDCLSIVPESQIFKSPLYSCRGETKSVAQATLFLRSSTKKFQLLLTEIDAELEDEIGIIHESHKPWKRRSWDLAKCLYDSDDIDLEKIVATDMIGYLIGIYFGRWNPNISAERSKVLDDPWIELESLCPSPAFDGGIPNRCFLVDDAGHQDDIVFALEEQIMKLEGFGRSELSEACCYLGDGLIDCRSIISNMFFELHIRRYSKSRRKAPIYWQIATPSARYSVWIYYCSLTRDSLYKVLNEYVAPKLQHEQRKLASTIQEGGLNPSANYRKDIDLLEDFVEELKTLHDEVARVAPFWNPDINDGVLINFAPLWRLVPQNKSWQSECKDCWDSLVAGEYDWSRLAMHLWPERVVPKCATDMSLAIAHDLEDTFWCRNNDGKRKPREIEQNVIDRLIKDRTSAAVKNALKIFLEAPIPTTSRSGQKKKAARLGSVRRKPSVQVLANGKNRQDHEVDIELLSKVRDAVAANGHGVSKAEIIETTGITNSEWTRAINTLMSRGEVVKVGERKGAIYQAIGGNS